MSHKIFTCTRTLSSRDIHLQRIDHKRSNAVQHASAGNFSLAFALFQEACSIVPHMPKPWRAHIVILQEIAHEVNQHFYEASRSMMMRHAQTIGDQFVRASAGEDVEQAYLDEVQEHTRNLAVAVELAGTLGSIGSLIDRMIEANAVSDELLSKIVASLSRPMPIGADP